ncbi:hypothetical protein EC973_000776 [Apophysomyces ossiformis]|uniref:Kaptin n=1 Tax=Apophysomyces ossiformis TaxID=679940 RepID=A0A8H7ESE3_9FUNG|nr:hypothetical protein EC973_000776 [Apophysomyces ossiformis]
MVIIVATVEEIPAMSDSANDDEFLFRETHYARYGFERTNIYGLATLDSRLDTYLDRLEEFPSHRYEKLPEATSAGQAQMLARPVRHFFSASAAELTAFISRDGYWNCLCVGLGLEAGKSEIIAVDVVEDHVDHTAHLLIAVALVEKLETEGEGSNMSYSLRIYGSDTPAKPYLEQTLFTIQDSCQIIPLSNPPMQISHLKLAHDGKQQVAFLLASTDGITHLFVQENQSPRFVEIPSAGHFPMIDRISELRIRILFMHVYDRPDGQRIICAGGQNGEIFLGFYDSDLVTVRTVREDDELHLVVTCAIEQAIVYRSVDVNGLSESKILPQSSLYDSVLCSHVMDVDWDGEREILIGTMTHLDLNRDGLDELIVTTMYGVHIFQPNMKKARERLLEVLQHVEGSKRQKYELLLEWQRQKEMEKAIVFEGTL